jgi:hypothetical protein
MRIVGRRRPSPALVVAIVALVVALGGTSYAAFSLPKNSVGTKQLKNGAVTTNKIKNGAVTGSKMSFAGVTVPNALHAGSANTAGSATNATDATNATNAGHATTADSATNASNASALNGNRIRWLLVAPSGTIVSQSGGFTVDTSGGAGNYIVNAGSPVSGHAITITSGWASDPGFRGDSIAGPCGAGPDAIDCGLIFVRPALDDGNHIFIETFDQANTALAAHSFYLVLY